MPAGQHADRHARREQAALTHSAQSAASGVAVTAASSDEHPSRHSAPLWNAYCIGEFPVGAHFRKQLPVMQRCTEDASERGARHSSQPKVEGACIRLCRTTCTMACAVR
jgi:hypothetical protein